MNEVSVMLWVLAVLLIIAGVAGLVLPVLPGAVLMLAGFFLAAWAENFVHVGPVILAVLAVLTVLTYAIDFLAGAVGAKRFGASRRAAVGAACGALIGIFFGIPGIIIGPFAGAVAGELTVRPDLRAAGLAGVGTWLGMVMGAAAKAAIGFTMLGIFILARVF
ncbi:MAG: DUF456 domain-containing protein [Desulfobacteraceae bacterium]|nr:MAG: DUF456 domain-containing protein [Desulfobacteraceae bacterium]